SGFFERGCKLRTVQPTEKCGLADLRRLCGLFDGRLGKQRVDGSPLLVGQVGFFSGSPHSPQPLKTSQKLSRGKIIRANNCVLSGVGLTMVTTKSRLTNATCASQPPLTRSK